MNLQVDGILVQIGGFEFFVHQTILYWIVLCIFIGALLVWAGKKFKEADPTKAPTGAVLVFEQFANMTAAVIGGNLQGKTWKYLPLMGTIMPIMVISNLLGLFGLQSPTSNLSVNITLAVCVFLLIHGSDIKQHGIKGKLSSWAEPMAFLFPLNVIGDFAFPVALTLRLFGNMLGGTIIVALLYLLVSNLMPYSVLLYAVTPFLHMYFDVFTAFMQTYIFFMLASFFLSQSIDLDD